jgi:hypothetical protein
MADREVRLHMERPPKLARQAAELTQDGRLNVFNQF